MIEEIRSLVDIHGRLLVPVENLDNCDNLWAAGLASFAAVQLLLALEDASEVEFPINELPTFETIDAIAANVSRLCNNVDQQHQ